MCKQSPIGLILTLLNADYKEYFRFMLVGKFQGSDFILNGPCQKYSVKKRAVWMAQVLVALLMSTLAGLSTILGGLFAVFPRVNMKKILPFALGLAAGVMATVSFCELLPEARRELTTALGRYGNLCAAAAVLGGLLLALLIDRTVKPGKNGGKLEKLGLVSALALTLHNFPEGITTFMAGYSNFRLGLPVTISIALHNIPEGIAVAVPLYYGTHKRGRALGLCALSGLTEPLGAVLAFLILAPFLSGAMLGIIYASVAGIMLFLSLNELLPASQSYGQLSAAVTGIALGAVIMLITTMVL